MLFIGTLLIGGLAAWALPFMAFALALLATTACGLAVIASRDGLSLATVTSVGIILLAGQVGFALGLFTRAIFGALKRRVARSYGHASQDENRPVWSKRWNRSI